MDEEAFLLSSSSSSNPPSPSSEILFNPFTPSSHAPTAPRKSSCDATKASPLSSLISASANSMEAEDQDLHAAAKESSFQSCTDTSGLQRKSLPIQIAMPASARALILPPSCDRASSEIASPEVCSDEMQCGTPPDKILPWLAAPPTPMAPRKDYTKLRPLPRRRTAPLRLDFGVHTFTSSNSLPASSSFVNPRNGIAFGHNYVGSAPPALPQFPANFLREKDTNQIPQ